MSQSKHTPGPWGQSHRKREDGMYATEVYDAKGETIATCAWYPVPLGGGHTATNRDANARLIAAAPDLLDACRAALEYDAAIQRYAVHGKSWVGGDDLDALYADWINKSRAAIDKVED